MPQRDPKCVFETDNSASAEHIANMLTAEGFPAKVMHEDSLGLSDRALEVWVVDQAHIDPAKKWLEEEMKPEQDARRARSERTGTVAVECEECGESSEWPAKEMGSTQVCPHCEKYMDIPDPDENWDDLDVGESEDDEDDEPEE